jgi:hypothetical protein
MLRTTTSAIALLSLLSLPALADESFKPSISGEVAIEVQNDHNYKSDDADAEQNELFTLTETTVVLEALPGLKVVAHGVLEPVEDPEAREDRVFEDHGLFMEELFLEYAHETNFGGLGLKAGKFNVDFGRGWDATPGVYGTEFAEDGYEITERVGFEGAIDLKTEHYGAHRMTLATFFADTSGLSSSTIQDRPIVKKADGGASNTEDFSSYALGLGGDVPGVMSLTYHLGFISQAGGDGSTADETGYAAALMYEIPVTEDLSINPFVEAVQQNSTGAVDGTDTTHLTGAVEATWKGWNTAVAYTDRTTETSGAPDTDDHQFQVSAGYEFENGLGLNVGWKQREESGIQSETVGALATYTIAY